MEPAAGPGYSAALLAEVRVPVLVIASEDNGWSANTTSAR
jgi:hypothetical protein